MSVQVVIALADFDGATVTAALQGTNVHPDAVDGEWAEVTSSTFVADGNAYVGDSAKLVAMLPYAWWRLVVSHAGGSPTTGTLTAYCSADVDA